MNISIIAGIVVGVIVIVTVVLLYLNFKKGSLSILLETKNFHDGETISGKVVLIIKKPLAKTGPLKVEVNCDEVQKQRDSKGVVHSSSRMIAHQEVILDNQQSMAPGEKTYDFKITLPSMVNSPKMMKDSFMGFMENKKLSWNISASLEIPGLNISSREDITVF